jgi:hypothetical protein
MDPYKKDKMNEFDLETEIIKKFISERRTYIKKELLKRG